MAFIESLLFLGSAKACRERGAAHRANVATEHGGFVGYRRRGRPHNNYLRDTTQICLQILDKLANDALKCGRASSYVPNTPIVAGGVRTPMVSGTHTRASLLERLQDGADPMAWDDFFHRYWPFVFSLARQRGCTEHTAEEMVQEVMLAIFEKKAVFYHDLSRGRFRDWLGGVVRNKVIARRRAPDERCRAQGGSKGLPEIGAVDDSHAVREEAAFEQTILAFLLDLVRREVHPRTYQAFEVFVLGGCSGAEASRLTGLTRNAVYQARKNVLRRLRELGAVYGRGGPSDELIRAAIASRPSAVVERSLLTRIEGVCDQ